MHGRISSNHATAHCSGIEQSPASLSSVLVVSRNLVVSRPDHLKADGY